MSAGGEQVACAGAEVDPWPEPGACGCRRRSGANHAPDRAERQPATVVQRSTERIDHAAEPGVGDGQGALVAQHDGPAAKVKVLGLGADDFIAKPLDRAELLARIQAIVRRSKGFSQSILCIGPRRRNMHCREVTVEGRMVPLTGKEYSIPELLVLRKGMVLTKEAFLNHLYGGMDEPGMKIIDVLVCKLRKKLAQAGADNMISTIWGRGYMVREPVVSHEGELPPAPLRIPTLADGPVLSAA